MVPAYVGTIRAGMDSRPKPADFRFATLRMSLPTPFVARIASTWRQGAPRRMHLRSRQRKDRRADALTMSMRTETAIRAITVPTIPP